MKNLKDKVAFITGGNSGIRYATAGFSMKKAHKSSSQAEEKKQMKRQHQHPT